MNEVNQLLRRAADRARLRPEYVGWILAQFGEIEGLDEYQLQQQLGVSGDDWPRLNLCFRPRPKQFLQDISNIAEEFAANRDALAAMVRKVEALQGLRVSQPSGAAGHLLAARSRQKKRTKSDNDSGGAHES